jgi:hypothetical protein
MGYTTRGVRVGPPEGSWSEHRAADEGQRAQARRKGEGVLARPPNAAQGLLGGDGRPPSRFLCASGQIAASRAGRESLEHFLDAALALDRPWHPSLNRKTYPAYLPSFDSFLLDLVFWRDEVDERYDIAESNIPPLDFTDPEAFRTWLAQLRTEIIDAVGAGEDANRPVGKRRMGRAMARSTLLEARRALGQLLDAATRGVGGLTTG